MVPAQAHLPKERFRRLGDDGEATELVLDGLDGLSLLNEHAEEPLAQKDVAEAQRVARLEAHGLRHVEGEGRVSFHEVGMGSS